MANNTDNAGKETRISRLKRTIANYMAGTDKMTQFWDACKIAEWALFETEIAQEANTQLKARNEELREALNRLLDFFETKLFDVDGKNRKASQYAIDKAKEALKGQQNNTNLVS